MRLFGESLVAIYCMPLSFLFIPFYVHLKHLSDSFQSKIKNTFGTISTIIIFH